MINPRAHFDAETGNEADLSTVGVHKYVEHHSMRTHLFVWCIEDVLTENYVDPKDGQVKQRKIYSILAQGQWRPGQPDPIPLLDHIAAGLPVVAHNAEFDRTVYNKFLRRRVVPHWPEWTIEQSDCTMARAAVLGIPEKLDFVAPVLGMELRKDPEGEKIMRLLSKPQTIRCVACKGKGTGELGYCLLCGGDGHFLQWFDTPENLDKLGTLRCDLDVEMESEVDHLCPYLTPTERRAWEHNQLMNERGLKLDIASVQRAIAIVEYGKQRLNARLSEITGGAVKSGTDLKGLLVWINEQGVPCDSMPKGEHEDIILRAKNIGNKFVEEVINIRRAISKPTSKFQRALQIVCADGRMRGLTHYAGAHTLRDAGRLMQVHNLYRVDEERDGKDIDITFDIFSRDIPVEEAYDQIDLVVGDPITAITKCTRRFIIAEEGKRFIGGDYSNVEGCGSAWLSGEQWKLDAYRAQQAEPKNKARDMYRVSYCKSFGGEPGATSDLQRQIGKVQELQLGYQGSVGAFVTMSEKQGFDLERLVPPVKAVTSQEAWDKALWLYSIAPATQRYGLEPGLWAPLKIIVMNWRAAHPMTTQAWWDQQDAAIGAVANPGTVVECCAGKIKYLTDRNILWCQLPSGGMRAYVRPHLVMKDTSYLILPDGERLEADEYNEEYTDVEINALLRIPGVEHKKRVRKQVFYEGYVGEKKRWGTHVLYGGRQHENNVQSFCRDILRFGVDNLEAAGYPVGLTVYDEALAEVPYGRGSPEEFAEIFGRKDHWYLDFPLAVKSWEDPRYAK